MIEFKTGDIFAAETEAIVNTVNCVGVMGRGIALQFKKRFPDNFKEYAIACKQEEVLPGKMFVHSTGTLTYPKYIINFPTKRHWKGKSRIEDIDSGLSDLIRVINEKNIKTLALPPLGCGLGGLYWSEVKNKIIEKLMNLQSVQIIVFEPQGAPPSDKMVKNKKIPKMTPGRAALIELIHRYLAGLLDPFITLLEVHKLMYFLQESGEKLRLNYKPAPYGPYAEKLRHVLNALEGHYISGYADGGDKPDKQLKLVPGAYKDASSFLSSHIETQKHFNRVSDLVEGFESPFGLELLSTVHWIAKSGIVTSKDVVNQVYTWSERKEQFTPHQIELAITILEEKKWIMKKDTKR